MSTSKGVVINNPGYQDERYWKILMMIMRADRQDFDDITCI